MRGVIWIATVFTLFTFTNGQVYRGYQYNQPYRYPYYKMAPVYSWYQRDQPEAKTEPDMEPKTEDVTLFEIQGLLYHNLHRKLHDSSELQLDHQLSLKAAQYAKEIASGLVIKHSSIQSRPGQSENIFIRCKAFSKGVSAFEAVKEWYSTVCYWNFDEPMPINDKGKPFSRLVWKSSQQMGIGRATFPVDNFNCTAVVARYEPSDLNTQDYANNVLRGKFVPTGCQYVNNVDNQDFILPPRPGESCQKISGFKGQMLVESSVCTIKQLFAIFGASVRRGKQGFSVIL